MGMQGELTLLGFEKGPDTCFWNVGFDRDQEVLRNI